jgi:hypothetical protein
MHAYTISAHVILCTQKTVSAPTIKHVIYGGGGTNDCSPPQISYCSDHELGYTVYATLLHIT